MYRKPSNNAPGILTETHETPFLGQFKEELILIQRILFYIGH